MCSKCLRKYQMQILVFSVLVIIAVIVQCVVYKDELAGGSSGDSSRKNLDRRRRETSSSSDDKSLRTLGLETGNETNENVNSTRKVITGVNSTTVDNTTSGNNTSIVNETYVNSSDNTQIKFNNSRGKSDNTSFFDNDSSLKNDSCPNENLTVCDNYAGGNDTRINSTENYSQLINGTDDAQTNNDDELEKNSTARSTNSTNNNFSENNATNEKVDIEKADDSRNDMGEYKSTTHDDSPNDSREFKSSTLKVDDQSSPNAQISNSTNGTTDEDGYRDANEYDEQENNSTVKTRRYKGSTSSKNNPVKSTTHYASSPTTSSTNVEHEQNSKTTNTGGTEDDIKTKLETAAKENTTPASKNRTLTDIIGYVETLCRGRSVKNDMTSVRLDKIALTAILTPFAGMTNNNFTIVPLLNKTVSHVQNKFAIGAFLEKNYKKWMCTSDGKSYCEGFCLGFAQFLPSYVLDVMINKGLIQHQTFRSTVLQVILVNPNSGKALTIQPKLSQPVYYTFTLYDNRDKPGFQFKCCVWQNQRWNSSVCATLEITEDEIYCSCDALGYTAAFLVSDKSEEITKPQTTKSTTTSSTTTPTTTTPTTTRASPTLPPQIKDKLDKLKSQKKSSLVNYKFSISAAYDNTVGKSKKETEEIFKGQIADQLKLDKKVIKDVNIAPGSIQVTVKVVVNSKNNISATEVHKNLQDKINKRELDIRDKNGKKLTIEPQDVGVEIEELEAAGDSTINIAVILGIVLALLVLVAIILSVAVYKKLKKNKEKILPYQNQKLLPYLNPTYKSFHHENTLDGTIESLVRIRRRSDQLSGSQIDQSSWKSFKGAGKNNNNNSHEIRARKSYAQRRYSQPQYPNSNSNSLRNQYNQTEISNSIRNQYNHNQTSKNNSVRSGFNQSLASRRETTSMPGFIDDGHM